MVCTIDSHQGAVCELRHVLGSVGDSQPIRDLDTVEEPPSDEATQTGGGVKCGTALFRKVSLIGFTMVSFHHTTSPPLIHASVISG